MTTEAPKLAAPVRREEYMIDPRLIDKQAGHNPRFDFGDIEALASHIGEQALKDGVGVLTALVLKRSKDKAGRYELVSGERRLMAVKLLMERGVIFAKGIPAKLMEKDASPIEMLLRDLVTNSGKPLLPLEEARAYKRLQDEGKMTIEQIAKQTGKNHAQVWQALQLLQADPDVIKAVEDGVITATQARELATKAKGDVETQKEAVAEMRAAGKDKKAKAVAKKKVAGKVRESQEKRVAAKGGKGKQLKMRALSDDQLSELGAKTSKYLDELLKDAGLSNAESLLSDCAADNKLAAAFTLGALQALKAAAGMKINLKL